MQYSTDIKITRRHNVRLCHRQNVLHKCSLGLRLQQVWNVRLLCIRALLSKLSVVGTYNYYRQNVHEKICLSTETCLKGCGFIAIFSYVFLLWPTKFFKNIYS